MATAIGYIRVSTSEQADSGLGLDAQRAKVEAMAVVKGYDWRGIVEDAGASAKDTNRDGLREVLAQVRGGLVDAVVISKLDRLTRSVKDLVAMIELFERKGVALVSCGESLDTSTAMGELMMVILGGIAQWERKTIGERTRDALAVKRGRGERNGNVQFGYTADTQGRVIEDDGEQAILAMMRDLREQGKGWQGIADALNGAGYRTRRGGAFSRQGVQHIFKRHGAS